LKQASVAVIATGFISLPWFVLPSPELPFLLALGAVAAVLSIKRPILAVLLFLCVSVFRIHEAYPVLYGFRLPLLFAILTVAALVYHVLFTRSVAASWPFQLRALAIFFLIVTLGNSFANFSSLAWDYWSSVFCKIALMTLAIAWLLREMRDFELVIKIIACSGVLLAVVAIQTKATGVGLVETTRITIGRELNSILGDPNELALILLLPLSFSLALIAYPTKVLDRTFAFLAAPLILLAIIFTQSRGGLLGMLAVFLVFALRLKSSLMIAVGLLLLALGLYQAMDISGRTSVSGLGGLDASVLERFRAWRGAIDMVLDRPLTGVGLANFPTSLPNYRAGAELAAHSSWLGVLGETGIPGFIAFVAMIASTIRSVLRSRRTIESEQGAPRVMRAFSTALLASIAGFCAAGTFLSLSFSWTLYTMVGLSAALAGYVSNSIASAHPHETVKNGGPDRESLALANVIRVKVDAKGPDQNLHVQQ
jgi:probable O-glycosylation ligase (exosortase A-associated)